MPLHETLGLMTAQISMPTLQRPMSWIERILGTAEFESRADAQRLVDMLMLAYNDLVTRLEKGAKVGPISDDPAIVEAWCRGFADAASTHATWMADERGTALLVPFETIARHLDPRELDEHEHDDPEALVAQWKAELPEYVRAIHEHWADARREHAIAMAGGAPTRTGAPASTIADARQHPPVGRKEPCPCGSGKRYKRCCGAG